MKLTNNLFPKMISFALIISLITGAMPLQAYAAATVQTQRISGQSRTLTAVEISKEGWAEGSDSVILARSDKFPDALAGAVLAQSYDAPILLTDSKKLSTDTALAISNLKAKNVFILGGTGAISAEIEKELAAHYTVVRIDGTNRYETSANIAKHLQANNKLQTKQAVIAYAQNFPDALAISSWAAQNGVPILLSEKDTLPEETSKALTDLQISKTIISGGTGVISTNIESKLPNPTRYGGNNRYETAISIINGLGQDIDTIFVATGTNFPDALAGSVLAARQGKAILLVGNNIDPSVKSFLETKSGKINKIYALGGTGVVTPTSLIEITNILAGIIEETPEQALTNALDSLKTLDQEAVDRYFSYDDFMDYEETNSSTPESDEYTKLIFAKLDHEIVSSSVNGDTANIKAKITNTDLNLVFKEFFVKMMEIAFDEAFKPEEDQLSDEEIDKMAEQILVDILKKEDNKTLTTTVDISLTRDGNSWKIIMDEKLQDAILGGLLSLLGDLSMLPVE